MTAEDFIAWRDRMRLTRRGAAEALGYSSSPSGTTPVSLMRWETNRKRIPLAVALACAALEAGLKPL